MMYGEVNGRRPRVLMLHSGGTLGMEASLSFEQDGDLREGSGGVYEDKLQPGRFLENVLGLVPELSMLGADLQLQVWCNVDSCRLVPSDWSAMARELDRQRNAFDSFVVITGTDTLAYVASALSFMLVGFNKPVVVTGSQRPLSMARSDARQNLADAVTCAVDGIGFVREVCVCFGGLLLRGNRTKKTHSIAYRAFSSPTFPPLARLGMDIIFRHDLLLPEMEYTPRFDICPYVMRVPVVPGLDPYLAYGSVAERGIRGVILEVFGVGNCDDRDEAGWIPWVRDMRVEGVEFFLTSQCEDGHLYPDRYRSGKAALLLGAKNSKLMTCEAATVKLMLALANPSISLADNLAGES